jgi:hypothetical protein
MSMVLFAAYVPVAVLGAIMLHDLGEAVRRRILKSRLWSK